MKIFRVIILVIMYSVAIYMIFFLMSNIIEDITSYKDGIHRSDKVLSPIIMFPLFLILSGILDLYFYQKSENSIRIIIIIGILMNFLAIMLEFIRWRIYDILSFFNI